MIGIWHIRYFFFTFCPAIIWAWETSYEDWKIIIRWCATDICSCKLCAKVSLMLENPFLVPSLSKSNHISICFIQICTKSLTNSLFPSGKATFFWSHPQCFEPLRKFQHNIKNSIETARVSRLSVSMTMILPSTIIKVLHIFKLNENLSLTVVNYQLKLEITKTFFETPVINSLDEMLDMIIDNQTNI